MKIPIFLYFFLSLSHSLSVSLREHEFAYSEDAFHRNTTKAARVRKGTNLKFDVLLTSYELVNVDAPCLNSIDWSVLVVDEAHRLKNNRSLVGVFTFYEIFSEKSVSNQHDNPKSTFI